MIIPNRTSTIPTVSIPATRALKVARFSVDGCPGVELVAPVSASVRPQAATAAVATVRPGRRAR